MAELLSLTPLEYVLIGFVALGIFLFFRACWRNIQQNSRDFLSIALLIAALSGPLLFSCRQGTGSKAISSGSSIDWNDSCFVLLKQALTYYNHNETDSLERFAAWSMDICAEHNQRQWYYNIWAVLAEAYVWDNQFDKAVAEAQRMREEADRRNENYGLFLAYKTLGVGYAHANNSKEATLYLKKAIGYFPKGTSPGELFYCYNTLCEEQLKMKCYVAVDSTLKIWQTEVNRYPVILGDSEATVHANFHFCFHSVLADYLLATGDYRQAEVAIDSAAYHENIAGNNALNLIAIAQQRSQLAREQGRTDEALKHSAHLLELASKNTDSSNLVVAYEEHANVLEKAGRFEEALKIYHRIDELKDSLTAIDQHDRLNQLNKQYAVSELQATNEQLEQRSRFTTGSIAMIMSIGAILVFLVYNSRWSRQLEIKNRQLQREHNVVVAQNKQLAIERDRAEAASKAKTAFIQSMTHEIRTPLNHISGFTQVLAMPDVELPAAERLEISQHIQEGTLHLTNILDDLIQISDLESSTELPPAEDYYPALIVAQALETVRPSVVADVSLENHCQVSDELMVGTYPHLIQTVLARLLDNAAKFTHLGSITLSLAQEGDKLHFSVADTGPGIPEDKRDFIFERFAKLDSFAQGTGLGLSVARMIAERLGGTLTLDTDYTGGSKFDFIIPASFKS
jgi:signal transduction histidine kinase